MIVTQLVKVLGPKSNFEILDLKSDGFYDVVFTGQVAIDGSVSTGNAKDDLTYVRVYSNYHVTQLSYRYIETNDISDLRIIYQIYVR